MIRKSAAILIAAAAACIAVSAQTPAPDAAPQSRVFSWTYDSNSGYLGVQAEEISKNNFAKFGLKDVQGVAVAKVVEGSPAKAAGVQDGDVIVSVNGEKVTSSKKLTRLIGEIAPDHVARVSVLRNGSERDIDVTIGKRPMPQFENGNFDLKLPSSGDMEAPDMPNLDKLPRIQVAPGQPGQTPMVWNFGNSRQIGVSLLPMSDQLASHFGTEGGALINEVRKDSPAEKAGLKAGDIIVEVDGNAVKGDDEVARAVNDKKDGSLRLTVLRNGSRQTISVTPEEVKGGFNVFEFDKNTPNVQKMLKMVRPATPSAPMPLNQFFFPGRVI